MARTAAIGLQDFGDVIRKNCFYVDKTSFIKEWWENEDGVTLITRPRRFGKTLTMSMLDYFFLIIIRMISIYSKDCQYGKKKSTGSCRGHIRLFF